MQTSLPIHTLDKSWLWCETWCSDEALAEAKTIDLVCCVCLFLLRETRNACTYQCNNPKTHEPKLARAKRLIPEWTVYDQEIAALAARVAAETAASSPSVGTGPADQEEDKSDTGALAFQDEAGQLQQARQQQVEFVEEGTGAEGESRLEQPPEEGQDARPPRDEL